MLRMALIKGVPDNHPDVHVWPADKEDQAFWTHITVHGRMVREDLFKQEVLPLMLIHGVMATFE